jgi:hypothetical protein
LFLASRNQKSLKIKLKILFSDFRFWVVTPFI